MTDTNLDKLERDVAHARGRFADDLALVAGSLARPTPTHFLVSSGSSTDH